ncbi:MAG TPA: polysaccharide deacetylase family protein [Bacteroidales bacterium]|nr:polysaccharide deacetylase family protein [Bacteroidales bacterium]
MNFYQKPPFWLKALTQTCLLWQLPAGKKRLYLTFDDGPNPGITGEILRLLSSFHAHATFFLLGEKALQQPALVDEILRSGHGLGSHGLKHIDGWKTSTNRYVRNVENHPLLQAEKLFRPPYGRITPAQALALKKRNFHIVMWSISARDYEAKTNLDKALKNLVTTSGDGSIVLFHDSPQAAMNCLYLLPKFLDHFLHENYRFEVLPGAYRHSVIDAKT